MSSAILKISLPPPRKLTWGRRAKVRRRGDRRLDNG
jgi:hypothetical protein